MINDKQHDDDVRGCTAVVEEMTKKRWSSGAPVHVLHCFSTAAAAAAAAAAAVGGAASFCTYTNFLFHFPFDDIYRFLLFIFLSLSGVLFAPTKPSNKTSGKSTDMIAGICTFPRWPCPSTTLHVMLNLTSATSTGGVCHTAALYVCSLLL